MRKVLIVLLILALLGVSVASALTYKDMARYPDKYAGQSVTLTGQAYQPDYSDSDIWGFRLATKQASWGEYYFEDDVYVFFYESEPRGARVLEGDIVRVEGTFEKLITYPTVLGASRTVPGIVGEKCTILS